MEIGQGIPQVPETEGTAVGGARQVHRRIPRAALVMSRGPMRGEVGMEDIMADIDTMDTIAHITRTIAGNTFSAGCPDTNVTDKFPFEYGCSRWCLTLL